MSRTEPSDTLTIVFARAAVRAVGMRLEIVVAEADTIFGSSDAGMVTVIAPVGGGAARRPEAGFQVLPLTDDVSQ